MTIYRIDNPLSDDGRNKINHNFEQMKKDVEGAVDEVSNMALEKVVDSAKIEWLSPVNTFNDLDSTYPDATVGKTVMTRDTGKVYRKQGVNWIEIQQIDVGPVNEVESRLNAEIEQKATKTELQAVASGSPKGVYTTLSELQAAFPTGTTGIYLVTADGNWYYWNSLEWTPGGIYQSSQWLNALTVQGQPWEVV